MADSEARRICREIVRIADGREEVPYGEIASDDQVEQTFETLVDTLKDARKHGLLSFVGEQLFRGRHDMVPITLTVKGFALKAEPSSAEPNFGKKVFFDGEDAMKEVAKPVGEWNWCLVGPDPVKLPLAGGGSGSIEQMTTAMGSHANTFGLLRVNFGRDKQGVEQVRWVYVHANLVDEDEEGQFSAVERGKAMAQGPKMEQTINQFVKVSCKMQGSSKDEFTVEKVLDKLLKAAGANPKVLTLDNYNRGVEELRDASPGPDEVDAGMHPIASLKPSAIEEAMQHIASLKPEPMVAEKPAADEMESIPEFPEGESKQRKKQPSYKIGDVIKVKVLGKGDGDWQDDGIVLDIAKEPILLKDGVTEIPVGSVKLQYQKDERIKWVLPFSLASYTKKSQRPNPPDKYSGDLWKETHGLFTTWHLRYFELQMGSLTWWSSRDGAKSGGKVHGCFPMLGLFTKKEGTIIKLTAQGCNGIVYSFDGGSEEIAAIWEKAFTQHGKFALGMCLYLEAQKAQDGEAEEGSPGDPSGSQPERPMC